MHFTLVGKYRRRSACWGAGPDPPSRRHRPGLRDFLFTAQPVTSQMKPTGLKSVETCVFWKCYMTVLVARTRITLTSRVCVFAGGPCVL